MTDERCFVDSNVLVYLFDDDFPAKQSRARELIAEGPGDLVLSVQVLGEFFHVATRKLRRPLAPEQALRAADHLGHLRGVARPSDARPERDGKEDRFETQLLGLSDRGDGDRVARDRAADRRPPARPDVWEPSGAESIPTWRIAGSPHSSNPRDRIFLHTPPPGELAGAPLPVRHPSCRRSGATAFSRQLPGAPWPLRR